MRNQFAPRNALVKPTPPPGSMLNADNSVTLIRG